MKKNIHLLNSGNAEERVAAIIALGNFGMAAKAAVPTLLIALDDGIAIIRESAAETLGKIGAADEKSILALIKCFSDEDPFISGKAITSLAKIGKPTVGYLTRSLADKKDDVRWCAAIALGKIAPAGAEAIPFLTTSLKDKNADVRWCSAIALGKFKGQASSAVPELLRLLNDDDRDVRWAAYVSLGKIDKEAHASAPELSAVIEKLETMTPLLMTELKVPGVSISVIHDFQLAWSKSFGVSDAVGQTAVNNQTVFEACSMSKPAFAYMVLKLIEKGKMDLDKPLSDYLEEPFVSADDQDAKLITARMILSHTSGMPDWRKGYEEREGPLPIYFKPGSKFSYSGEGIYYLQRVVEHITGEPLASFATRNLFASLGLESASFIWTDALDPRIATGHDASGSCLKRSKYTHANAAYTLYTTAEEYAKFIVHIMKPNAADDFSLSGKMTKEMLAHQARADTRDVIDRPGRSLGLAVYRGLGWGINETISGDIVYHSGANQTGFKCYSQFDMHEGSGIVIMTNSRNGGDLWSRLISAIGDL